MSLRHILNFVSLFGMFLFCLVFFVGGGGGTIIFLTCRFFCYFASFSSNYLILPSFFSLLRCWLSVCISSLLFFFVSLYRFLFVTSCISFFHSFFILSPFVFLSFCLLSSFLLLLLSSFFLSFFFLILFVAFLICFCNFSGDFVSFFFLLFIS